MAPDENKAIEIIVERLRKPIGNLAARPPLKPQHETH
jgi:hypothetical protein